MNVAVANSPLDAVPPISLGKLASTTLIAFALCIAALLLRRYLGQMSLVWHANAFLVAVLIGSPRKHWLPILVGGWIANLTGNLIFYPGSATAHLTPIFNTLEIWLCAELPLRIMKGDLNLSRSRDLSIYTIFGAIAAPAVGGLARTILLPDLRAETFWNTFSSWWSADSLSMLIVTPSLLALRRQRDGLLELRDPLIPARRHLLRQADLGIEVLRLVRVVVGAENAGAEVRVRGVGEGLALLLEQQRVRGAHAVRAVLVLIGRDVVAEGLAPQAPCLDGQRSALGAKVADCYLVRHLLRRGRNGVERGGAVRYMVRIDCLDHGGIREFGGADKAMAHPAMRQHGRTVGKRKTAGLSGPNPRKRARWYGAVREAS